MPPDPTITVILAFLPINNQLFANPFECSGTIELCGIAVVAL